MARFKKNTEDFKSEVYVFYTKNPSIPLKEIAIKFCTSSNTIAQIITQMYEKSKTAK